MTALLRVYTPEECKADGYPVAWSKCPRCEGHGWIAMATDSGHPNGICQKPLRTSDDDEGFVAYCCDSLDGCPLCKTAGSIKQLVRLEAGHRCIRCRHPFVVGESGEMEGPSAEAKATAAEMGMNIEMMDRLFEDMDYDLPPEIERKVLDKARRINWSDCDAACRHQGPFRFHYPGQDWSEIPGPPEGHMEIGPEGYLHLMNGATVQAAWRVLTVHHLDGDKANCRWWNLVALCQRCHLEIQGKVEMTRPWPWEHTDWFRIYAAAWYAWKYEGTYLTRQETEDSLDDLLLMGREHEGVERMPI